ncbi:MAG: dTDP-4-dehydrorhamnose 3,5-epimerase family protein [Patescibacteria group bacterium]|nr:dTDP-4-dehydrorhamnose 3,5-epimerase family protein [Patescibacteria group bacterium]
MLEGVRVKKLKIIKDERGFLMEILRSDEKFFQKFGQVYLTFCKYGIAKAWHYHKLQDDYFVCLEGKALIGLYDHRKNSKTYGQTARFILSAPQERGRHLVLRIPRGVVHGFTALTKNGAKILNLPTKVYNYKNPDEYRMPWQTKEIPFRWPSFVRKGG